jgi:hypothetical protein
MTSKNVRNKIQNLFENCIIPQLELKLIWMHEEGVGNAFRELLPDCSPVAILNSCGL